jgi:enoyl-CoA hydratase/carnithine racemase
MADPIVLYDVDDKVGVITLNRPDKLNAISHELQHALTEAFARAEADAATSVVLLRAEGRTASLAYAKRLSLISPEALYATKRAVNRVADAAGFRTALYAGLDVVGPLYATATEHGTQFREIARQQGVPAAVRWRSAQFKA